MMSRLDLAEKRHVLSSASSSSLGLGRGIPIVLLPARIETRFVARSRTDEQIDAELGARRTLLRQRIKELEQERGSAGFLLVRIFPDDVGTDSHEPELTTHEQEATELYWEAAWSVRSDAGRAAAEKACHDEGLARSGLAQTDMALIDRHQPSNLHTHDPSPRWRGDEPSAVRSYWSAWWSERCRRESAEDAAWRGLCRAFGPERAGYIVATTTPAHFASARPQVPRKPHRPGSWTRAAHFRGLPDRWTVRGTRGGKHVLSATSSLTRDRLACSIDPTLPPDPASPVPVDRGTRWLIDFEEAVRAGQAIRIPVDAETWRSGLDRLLVYGVCASETPEATASELHRLLEGKRYTAGIDVLAQGTPVRGQQEGPAPTPGTSFSIERGRPSAARTSDAYRLAWALGCPDVWLAHNMTFEWHAARAMNNVLWPVTLGSFLAQTRSLSLANEADLRNFFVDHATGRGPLAALRIGELVYGVLPVTRLRGWKDRSQGRAWLADVLVRIRDEALAASAKAPHVAAASPDPAGRFAQILATAASAREVWVRHAVDEAVHAKALADASLTAAANREQARDALVRHYAPWVDPAGRPIVSKGEWLESLLYADDAYPFGQYPLVTDSVSESAPLPPGSAGRNYIGEIAADPLVASREQRGRGPLGPLLRRLLALAASKEASIWLEVSARGMEAKTQADDTFPLGPIDARPVSALLAGHHGASIWREHAGYTSQGTSSALTAERIRAFRAALDELEWLPSAELERLLGETLDVCSHRVDAWETSLASARLVEIRASTPHSHCGMYGWVEDLRRSPDATPRHGLAPSLDHAAALAVLHSAALESSGVHRGHYAVDLSSARVRRACEVLDMARAGMTVGEALGIRFERQVRNHPRYETEAGGALVFLRRTYPLPRRRALGSQASPQSSQEPIDGVALWEMASDSKRRAALLQTLSAQLPHPELGPWTAALDDLVSDVDAVADLQTAEAVFQLVRGNADNAAAIGDALSRGARPPRDALSRGARPPQPMIAETVHPSRSVGHRVAVVIGSTGRTAWGASEFPGATIDPQLDNWLGRLLGDPARIRFDVQLTLSDLQRPPAGQHSLAELAANQSTALSPLEIVQLCQGEEPLRAVGAHIERSFRRTRPDVAAVEIVWEPALLSTRDRTIPDLVELARLLAEVISGARPLTPQDVAVKRVSRPATILQGATDKLRSGIRAVVSARTAALAALAAPAASAASALSEALFGLWRCGLDSAAPTGSSDIEELRRQATDAIAAASDREAAASAALADARADPTEALKKLFGSGYVSLPPLPSASLTELRRAEAKVQHTTLDVEWWFQSVAPIRPRIAALRRLQLGLRAMGGLAVELVPHHLGASAVERWAAVASPAGDRLSMLLHAPDGLEGSTVGMFVDGWVERVPLPEFQAGLAVHADAPASQAPQAILIAVPPDLDRDWDHETLQGILDETLERAKIRATTTEWIGDVGQLLPLVHVPANTCGHGSSADLRDALLSDPRQGEP